MNAPRSTRAARPLEDTRPSPIPAELSSTLAASRLRLVESLVNGHVRIANVVGGPGVGKTTVLEQVAGKLGVRVVGAVDLDEAIEHDILVIDDADGFESRLQAFKGPKRLIFATMKTSAFGRPFRLLPLDDDEQRALIEAHLASLGVPPDTDVSRFVPLTFGNPLVASLIARRLRASTVHETERALKTAPLECLRFTSQSVDRSMAKALPLLTRHARRVLLCLGVFEEPLALDALSGDAFREGLEELLDSTLAFRREHCVVVPCWVRAFALTCASAKERREAEGAHDAAVAKGAGGPEDIRALLHRAVAADAPPELVGDALLAALRNDAPVDAVDSFLDRVKPTRSDAVLVARAWIARAERDAKATKRACAAAASSGDPSLVATALITDGLWKQRRGDARGALRAYRQAYETEQVDDATCARALVDMGTALHDLVRLDEAREHYERALAVATGRIEGAAWLNLGVLTQEEGELSRAKRAIERAIVLFESDRRLRAIAKTSLGAVLHEAGEARAAAELHAEASVLLHTVGDTRSLGLCMVREAVARADAGDAKRARHLLDEAEPHILRAGESALRVALNLARSLVACVRGESAAAKRFEHLAGDASRISGATPAAAAVSDDVRFLLRLGERGKRPTLRLATNGRTVTLPSGDQRNLERQPAAWRIVLALAEVHGKRALTLEELWAAGWPGQRAVEGAWQNRVHVALTYLRNCGMRPFVRRDDAGYSLGAELDVQLGA